MIRRSPAEFYIKYLVLHPAGYSNNKIREILGLAQLDYAGDDHLERVRDLLTPPHPFYPTDRRHQPSFRFLSKERVQRLFHPDADMNRALEVLDNARVKEFLESMTLAGATPHAIAAALSVQRRFSCTSKVVELYQHYFWNISLVDTTELRALITLRSHTDVREGDIQATARADAFKKASYQDPRRVAADLPNAPLVALLSQMRMGIMPTNIDLAKALDALQKAASLRSLEATFRDGFEDSKKSLDYINVARIAAEMLENVVKPDEKLREQLASIVLTTETREVPTIQQLSAGKHTSDLGPPVDEEAKYGEDSR